MSRSPVPGPRIPAPDSPFFEASMNRLATITIAALATLAQAGCGSRDTPAPCDRRCLIEIADGYLAALAAHDPAAISLSDDVVFVENLTAMKPGGGLWSSAAGKVGGFRIHVPDPVEGTIGVMAVLDRQTKDGVAPALLALRLKVDGRTITEAEHLVAGVPDEADPK